MHVYTHAAPSVLPFHNSQNTVLVVSLFHDFSTVRIPYNQLDNGHRALHMHLQDMPIPGHPLCWPSACASSTQLGGRLFGMQPYIQPYGPGPPEIGRAGHHWASPGVGGHCEYPRLGRMVAVFCPHKKHRKPIPMKCAVPRGTRTGASARRVNIKAAFTPGQHCTWDSSSTRGTGAGATQDRTRLGGTRAGDAKERRPAGITGPSARN